MFPVFVYGFNVCFSCGNFPGILCAHRSVVVIPSAEINDVPDAEIIASVIRSRLRFLFRGGCVVFDFDLPDRYLSVFFQRDIIIYGSDISAFFARFELGNSAIAVNPKAGNNQMNRLIAVLPLDYLIPQQCRAEQLGRLRTRKSCCWEKGRETDFCCRSVSCDKDFTKPYYIYALVF